MYVGGVLLMVCVCIYTSVEMVMVCFLHNKHCTVSVVPSCVCMWEVCVCVCVCVCYLRSGPI